MSMNNFSFSFINVEMLNKYLENITNIIGFDSAFKYYENNGIKCPIYILTTMDE